MVPAKRKIATALVALVLAAGAASGTVLANAQDAGDTEGVPAGQAVPPAGKGIVVLDTFSNWRMHSELAPPVLSTGEEAVFKVRWLNHKTPPAPENWAQLEFNDQSWHRGPGSFALQTALLERICLRGKFTVTDPEAVGGLWLWARYRGGIVVYLNGREIHREYIARGETIAEGRGGEERELVDVPIPTALLRKGMNVIGLEAVRARYPESGGEPGEDVYNINTCEITRARLRAADSSGLVPNARRPEGLQVWNADTMASDVNLDFGDAAEPLRQVRIVAARNGMFSGKVVVGSTEPIRGLKVTPGSIEGEGGRIPASAVRIRYGIPWGDEPLTDRTKYERFSPYPTWATFLGALAERPLDEFSVMPPERRKYYYNFLEALPGQPEVVPGAVVPIWITVNVPKEISAGMYAGKVKIEVQGERPVEVPVELKVADWTLRDTQDYRTWVDLMQCPDTLALEYDVPLWSERHFELIGRSLKLIGETGARTLYIPLIAHTHACGEESMVRWIRKGDGYEYDFSVMEKYLDVAEKNMGRPKLLVFVVWDYYMMDTTGEAAEGHSRLKALAPAHLEKVGDKYRFAPMVTAVDPDSGETEAVILPPHTDTAASKALWRPLFDELRRRMKARGLEQAMMLGLQGDIWVSKEEVAFFDEVTDGLPWAMHSHAGHPDGRLMYDIARVGYQARVWVSGHSDDGAYLPWRDSGKIKSLGGWKRKELYVQFDRMSDAYPCTRWRPLVETAITGTARGTARLGADYWAVLKNKRGQRIGRAHVRYPESDWHQISINTSLLAPSPEGPAATSHMEAFREGVQECEARIQIERALGDEGLKARLGEDLVRRCEEYLHARHMMMWLSVTNLQCYHANDGSPGWGLYLAKQWRICPAGMSGHYWFLSSGWQERTWQLFSLAGEVAAKLEEE